MKNILFILLIIIAGCRTTKHTDTWKRENVSFRNNAKVLILPLLSDSEPARGDSIADTLSSLLRESGINTVTSAALFGPRPFDRMDEEDALYQLNYHCIDLVLTVTLLDRQQEKNYAPGTILYTPYQYYYDRFWRYRNTMRHRFNEAEYFTGTKQFFLECNLFDMITQKPVYSLQTGSSDLPVSAGEIIKISKQLIASLQGL